MRIRNIEVMLNVTEIKKQLYRAVEKIEGIAINIAIFAVIDIIISAVVGVLVCHVSGVGAAGVIAGLGTIFITAVITALVAMHRYGSYEIPLGCDDRVIIDMSDLLCAAEDLRSIENLEDKEWLEKFIDISLADKVFNAAELLRIAIKEKPCILHIVQDDSCVLLLGIMDDGVFAYVIQRCHIDLNRYTGDGSDLAIYIFARNYYLVKITEEKESPIVGFTFK